MDAVKLMGLERQNKYFSHGPRSHFIRDLLYTYTNKPKEDETGSSAVFERYSVHTSVLTPMYGLPLKQSDRRMLSTFQSVYTMNIFASCPGNKSNEETMPANGHIYSN